MVLALRHSRLYLGKLMKTDNPLFERVYSHDWYDGPRTGVADYKGQPPLFASEWDDRMGSRAHFYYNL